MLTCVWDRLTGRVGSLATVVLKQDRFESVHCPVAPTFPLPQYTPLQCRDRSIRALTIETLLVLGYRERTPFSFNSLNLHLPHF